MIIAMKMIKEGKNNGSGGCTRKGRIKGRSFLLGANRLNLEEEHFNQAPPSVGFSRQEYWSGVPLPSPLAFLLGLKHAH